MTEAEWFENPSAGRMLEAVHRFARADARLMARKYRLFACYLLRPLARHAPPDGRYLAAVDAAEACQLGAATWADVTAAVRTARDGMPESIPYNERTASWEALRGLEALVADRPVTAAQQAVGAATSTAVVQAEEGLPDAEVYPAAQRRSQGYAPLIREMFGNPFRPVRFAPWRTAAVVGLAETMFRSGDFTAMPILADALEEAGCEVPAVLEHCRDPEAVHVRGCWVLDGVLGKS